MSDNSDTILRTMRPAIRLPLVGLIALTMLAAVIGVPTLMVMYLPWQINAGIVGLPLIYGILYGIGAWLEN